MCAAGLIAVALAVSPAAQAGDSGPREGHFSPPDPPAHASLDSAHTAGYYQTSEYLIGSVAVGLILPESDGSIDSQLGDWTLEQRQRVLDEVTQALDWWTHQATVARLSFVIDDHASQPLSTGYEPITRPQYDEGLWIAETLAKLDYTDGSHWTRVRRYVNDLRTRYHTDWAFAVFVVNSDGDSDAAFLDRYFAYAYVGGPFFVMTYSNAGYGIGNMDAVAAHETGHIFRALDQYASANVACTALSGYLGIETQNSQRTGCASDVPSIMRGGIYPYLTRAIDPFAASQLGWRDSDADGIFDPVDTTPALTVEASIQADGARHYAGHAWDTPYPSPLRPAATINSVRVEYRVDGGAWSPANADDGDFDTPDESYTLTISQTQPGNHRVALRAHNSVGNLSAEVHFTVAVPDPLDGGLDTWLEAPESGLPGTRVPSALFGLASSLNPDGTAGTPLARVEYRFANGDWLAAQAQDGAYDSAEESFAIPVDVQGGSIYVEARAVDADGKVEQNMASLELHFLHTLYMPMLAK